MVIGELDIGIRPDLIPPIIQVTLVYHQVFIDMVMAEVDIGIRTANFIHQLRWTKHCPPKVYSRRNSKGRARRKST